MLISFRVGDQEAVSAWIRAAPPVIPLAINFFVSPSIRDLRNAKSAQLATSR